MATKSITVNVAALAFAICVLRVPPGAAMSAATLAATGDGLALVLVVQLMSTGLVLWVALSLIRPERRLAYLGVSKRPMLRDLLPWLFAQAAITSLDVVVSDMWGSHERSGWSRQITETASLLPLFLASIVLVGPMAEELFYRGLALGPIRSLSLRRGATSAVVLAWTLVWAIEHGGTPAELLVLVVSGATFSAARL